jgi:phage xkdN-like protein
LINRRENNKMSKFSAFMKANKKVKENEKFAPTASLLGSDGKPVRWEFRHITSKENEELRDANTIEVQVMGKPNLFRPKLITSKYLMAMIVKSTVFPDLYDKELQDSYGVMTPEDLVYAMVDNAGEMQDFQLWMQKFQGFTKSLDEKVDEAKN